MAHFLFCWELGTGRGHLTPHLAAAESLRDAGHAVTFAVRQLQHAEALLGGAGVPYVQAPTWTGNATATATVRTYAQVLLNVGFADVDELVGRVRAWRALFAASGADALVTDHAPTALLAARGLGLPCAVTGNGFVVPPLRTPLPALVADLDDAARADEARVLANANAALARIGAPGIDQLADLFDVEARVLRSFPEFDHYRERDDEEVLPFVGATADGAAPDWPDAPGPRVFAYLRPGPLLQPALSALRRRRLSAIVAVDGVPARALAGYQSPNLCITPELHDLTAIAREGDLAVLNANHSTSLALLLGGCPLVLLPQQLEQRLFAERVATLGAGVMVGEPKQTAVDLAIEAALDRPEVRGAARGFAAKYAGFDAGATERRYARCIAELAGGHPGKTSAAAHGILH